MTWMSLTSPRSLRSQLDPLKQFSQIARAELRD